MLAGGPAAAAEESDAAAARPNLTLGGQPLVDLLRADPTDLDPRAMHAYARLFGREGGAKQPAPGTGAGGDRDRDRRIRHGAAVGAGIGAAAGYFSGYSWCDNESGGSCSADPLTLGFAGLGALVGAGIGAALGAIGGQ